MNVLHLAAITKEPLVGRILQRVIGKGAASESGKMTIAYCRYSAESGRMEPHRHAEETVVITECENGWVRRGPSAENLPEKVMLSKGTVLHFEEMEWHVFEHGDGGFIEALCIYGQVDNIRPEDILAAKSAR